jgi:hypothetical protein
MGHHSGMKRQQPSSKDRSSTRTFSPTLLMVCSVATLVLLGAAWFAGTWDPPEEGTTSFEFRKYLIQFLLLVALGAVVAFIVEDTNRRITNKQEDRRKEEEEEERERQSAIDIVTELLDRLGEIYRRVKKLRYSIRLVPEAGLTKRSYLEAINELHAEKQALEVLWQDIQTNARWLPDLAPIWPQVEEMESYLRPIETEAAGARDTPDAGFSAASQPEFMAFLAKWKSGQSSFPKFRGLHQRTRAGLVDLLASLRGIVTPMETAVPGPGSEPA